MSSVYGSMIGVIIGFVIAFTIFNEDKNKKE
jgi:high-affinity Fe2+/Pb2+ permease